MLWARMLVYWQSLGGAKAANDLKPNDTVPQIKRKILKSLNGE